jgi:predicted amidohydrolase
VNPWGHILLDMGEETGVALVEIDPTSVAEARSRIPVLQHRRPIGPVSVAP